MEEFDLDLLDDIGALVVILDDEGRIAHWNEACTRLTGYDLEEARGEYVWDLLLVDDEAEAVKEEFERSKEADPTSQFENYWVTRDGEKRWISWSNSRKTGPDDSVYVVATGVDRTEAKRNEQKLRRSRAKLRSILELAPNAIVVVDEDQNIVLFNEGAERIFGWNRDEIVGEPLEQLIPEEFHDVHREHVRAFAEGDSQSRRMGEASMEIRGRRRNGDEFLAEAAISKVDLDGEMLFTTILRDLTERRSLEESLRDQLEQRDEFVRRIVHDLRNPLNTISLRTQLLERKTDELDDSLEESVTQITEASKLMERLLDDLLELASAQTDNLTIRTSPTDLASVVSDATSRHRPRAREAGLDLTERLPDSLPPVEADRIRLTQVFDNLLDNALKFTPEGGEVEIGVEPRDDRVVITVGDSGPGIDEENADRVFEPFYQENSDDRRGAGLGLAIVKSIVESHDGSIRVESVPGEGTTFAFTLPVAD